MVSSTDFDTNVADAAAALRRFADAPTAHLIDGRSVASETGETFDDHSPVDGTLLGRVASGGAADVDAAAAAAAAAYRSWSRTPGPERKAVLHRIADGIERRAREIALVESIDTGQAIRFMSSAAVRGQPTFGTSPIRPLPQRTGGRYRRRPTSTTPPDGPSGRSGSSPRGTHRSC